MKTANKKALIFISLNIIMVLAASILSYVSSSKAYAISNINLVLILGAADILMGILILATGNNPALQLLRDLALLVSVITATLALCAVVSGRANLMGFVWFSDLEKSNAVAVSALNLSVYAWVCYAIGILADVIAGCCGAAEKA